MTSLEEVRAMPPRFAAAIAILPLMAVAGPAAGAEPVRRCELPGVQGTPGPAQLVQFQILGTSLKRLRAPDGSGGMLPETAYPVITDDGDTIIGAALDFPPVVTLVTLVRSTGLLKLTVITNDRTAGVVSIGSCRAG